MGNYSMLPVAHLLLILFSCAAAHHPQKNEYHLQLKDFPNERLYRAYLVIQRFKGTITGDPKNVTFTWTGRDLCGQTTYVGFHCAKPLGKELTVTAVILNGYGLRAPTLQGFVDQLPDLLLFHAASNHFGSDIPRLDNLPYKYELSVGDDLQFRNQLRPVLRGSGRNTGGFGCVTANINYDFNIGFTTDKGRGIIPGAATDAKALLLNYNHLSGQLPANLGFSKLSYLALANNKLTGPIPSSVAHLQDSLLEVLLLNNQLSGCLPHQLGMLTKTAVIDAGMNQLTGPIPSSFSCLASVEQLNLAGNRLYGEVPDTLCKLAVPTGRLANLTLSGNYFTSVGPACSSLIKDGLLNVRNNCIPGFANQRGPAECASFLSQPNKCPAATTHVTCPAAAVTNAVPPPEGIVPRAFSSYVTYATLHE